MPFTRLLLLLPMLLPALLLAEPRRPNIVILLADDQGIGDLSLHGHQDLQTPNLDALAHQGAQLTRFYVSPVCSPTRAELLTGRQHPRTGVRGTSAGDERLNLDETTLADLFKAAGYATGCFGKWHNGSQYPYHPLGRGFDEFFGIPSGHWAHYFDWWVEHNGEPVDFDGYITDVFTDRAIDFIQTHRERPFFCYLAFNTPHDPMQVPDRFHNRLAGKELQSRHPDAQLENLDHTRAALAMVANIDENVGRILQALHDLQLQNDTIVIYLSDNGPNGWRYNMGLRGRKASTDEGGVRSPCFIRWPGHIAPDTRLDTLAAAIDVLPTLVELTDIHATPAKPLDGISLAPQLLRQSESPPDRLIFAHWNNRVSVRNQRYILDATGRLYDLLDDPGQQHDIAAAHPDIAHSLQEAVRRYRHDILRQPQAEPRPFPVGYPIMPATYLPARDGIAHGSIERSNRYPNASFFQNWTSRDDTITWDVDIHTAGQYEAIIHYTVRPQDVGCVIRLSLHDAHRSAPVIEAFDPPLIGAEHDRVPRIASYAKRFAPLNMGRFHLPAGRTQLTLAATHIPGERAIDVGGITLRLLDE